MSGGSFRKSLFSLAKRCPKTGFRGRELFLRAYGYSVLRGQASTIADVREKASGGAWTWEAELTVPPPRT